MQVSSKTFIKDRVVQEEFIEIRWDEETNNIIYMPTLNGKRLNTFFYDQAQITAENQAVFVDPNNKTLKKLVYSLKSQTVLNIRLFGNEKDGRPFEFEYDMNQDICPRPVSD